MSYSWYRTDSAFHRHPKMLALKAELKEPLADAYVSRLWSWAQLYAPSGRFPAALVAGLESELCWTGSTGSLAAALEKCGWLDREGADVLVHDWPDFQGYHVKKSRKDADKKRKRKARASARTGRGQKAPSASEVVWTAPPTDGRDGRTDERTTSLVLVDVPPTPAANSIFEHWRQATGKARAMLDAKRRDLIDRRLAEGHRVEDLKAAIDGYARSPWHTGKNPDGKKYLKLELMLRDAAHIEAGLDLLMEHSAAVGPKSKFLTDEQRKDLYADGP